MKDIYKDEDIALLPKQRERYCVIGKPIGHSFSGILHNMFFRLSGHNEAEYLKVEISNLDSSIDNLKDKFDGFNVTVPYKIDIMKYLDEIDEKARIIGSVNTVKVEDGKLIGYNTDIDGFMRTLERDGIDVNGKKCLVIGYGGVAKTVAYALSTCGGEVYIAGRNQDKIDVFCKILQEAGVKVNSDTQLNNSYDIVVNATPVGMFPNISDTPVDTSRLKGVKYCFDLIYNPRRTRFMREMAMQGAKLRDGLYMLIVQGAVAEEEYFGKKIDVDIVDNVYRKVAANEFVSRLKARGINNIVLIGFMGSGKSTVGKALGDLLEGCKLVDTDNLIEEKYGKISDIFDSYGETRFREIEHDVLAETLQDEEFKIISTGGGIVENHANNDILKNSNNIIIYLSATFNKLKERAMGSGRPLFRDEHKAFELYNSRLKKYESLSDTVINAEDSIENQIDELFMNV